MQPIIYSVAIAATVGGAALSIMNSMSHQELTKETHEFAGKNDALEAEIKAKQGKNLKIENFKDPGLNAKASVEDAIKLRFARAISGHKIYSNFLPKEERPAEDRANYTTGNLTFKTFNKTAENKSSAEYKYITLDGKGLKDVKTGRAVTGAATAILSGIKPRMGILEEKITSLNREIDDKKADQSKLEKEIAEFKKAEDRIKSLFKKENLETLQDGKDKLVELEATRKDRLNEVDTLTQEKDDFSEKLKGNEKTLAKHNQYYKERKKNLSYNTAKYRIASVNFDWGFAILRNHDKHKFFINQRLMVLRGTRYIGDMTVSGIEPGRILCNIEYKTVRNGARYRAGDRVILAQPLDR